MLKLCALSVLLLAVNADLLGTKKCTYGPSYWCDSFEQASECGGGDYCLEKVWRKNPVVTGDDTDACTFCKDIVADVKTFIESNKTRSVILDYLQTACDYLPDDYSQGECKKIGTHYLDEFESAVASDVDPETVCSLCRLCNSKRAPQKDLIQAQPTKLARVSLKPATLTIKQNDDTMCDACKSFMALLKNEVDNKQNQDKLKALLKSECKQIGGDMAAECELLVDSLFPELITFLDKELSDQACATLGLCKTSAATSSAATSRLRQALRSATVQKALMSSASRLNADACDTCEMIAGYAKIMLSNNATEQEIEQLLTNDVCPQLGQFSDMCKTLVEEYVPQIYSLLLKELDPATICTDLGLCKNSSSAATATPKPRVKASPQCILCEFVMSKLEDTLEKNASEEQIIAAVEKVCSILPSSVRQECDDLVEKYGKAIISLIVHDASPDVVCKMLGLCASGSSVYKLPLVMGDAACEVCDLTLTYVHSLLEKNATQEQIVQTVEKVCNYLSGDLAGQCNSLVETYGPMIVKLLADDVTPQSVCATLKLCQSKTVKVDGRVHLYNEKAANY